MTMTISTDRAPTTPVTVRAHTADGSATAPSDYRALPPGGQLVTLAAGQTSRTVAISVAGDLLREPAETFAVTLANPSGATIADGTARGRIVDDDTCTIVGTAGNDILRGTAGDDEICGLGGHDTIAGAGGDDELLSGAGDDVLLGLAGNDHVDGQGGVDLVEDGAGSDLVRGGPGNDRSPGGATAGVHGGTGVDTIDGGPGADWCSPEQHKRPAAGASCRGRRE